MIEKIIEASARNRFLVFLMVGFLTVMGIWALKNTPLDAVPDLSDVQVIVYTPWMGRNPQIIEDQVTYPIVTTMISAPKVKVVRGFPTSGFLMCTSSSKTAPTFTGREAASSNT